MNRMQEDRALRTLLNAGMIRAAQAAKTAVERKAREAAPPPKLKDKVRHGTQE